MGVPGWPLFAFCTASIERHRMVLIDSCSTEVEVAIETRSINLGSKDAATLKAARLKYEMRLLVNKAIRGDNSRLSTFQNLAHTTNHLRLGCLGTEPEGISPNSRLCQFLDHPLHPVSATLTTLTAVDLSFGSPSRRSDTNMRP